MLYYNTVGSTDSLAELCAEEESIWMTKADLVERVSDRINLTKKQTELIVNTLFTSIADALTQGDKVELRGFGSFRVRRRHSRDGRNPKTGQGVHIPPKKVPFFKAGKELREMVDN
jgi:integration host factor subunit beta